METIRVIDKTTIEKEEVLHLRAKDTVEGLMLDANASVPLLEQK